MAVCQFIFYSQVRVKHVGKLFSLTQNKPKAALLPQKNVSRCRHLLYFQVCGERNISSWLILSPPFLSSLFHNTRPSRSLYVWYLVHVVLRAVFMNSSLFILSKMRHSTCHLQYKSMYSYTFIVVSCAHASYIYFIKVW